LGTLVSVKDVHKSFDHMGRNLEVLRGIDLSIDEGRLSPSSDFGAGKSTLRSLHRYARPSDLRQDIELAGEDITLLGWTKARKLAGLTKPNDRFVFSVPPPAPESTRSETCDPGSHPRQDADEMEAGQGSVHRSRAGRFV